MSFDPDWTHGHMTIDKRRLKLFGRDYHGYWAALVEEDDGKWIAGTWHESTIINAPAPPSRIEGNVWVNVGTRGLSYYSSKALAEAYAVRGQMIRTGVRCRLVEVEE